MRRYLSGGLLLVALACAPLATAQNPKPTRKERAEEATKRSLEGVVQNETGGAVDGAVVQLKDLKTLQVRSYITKHDGKYHFYNLSVNNDYEVKAEFNKTASRTRTLSVFDQRKKAILDLKLETPEAPEKK
jgi:hypothetical protein